MSKPCPLTFAVGMVAGFAVACLILKLAMHEREEAIQAGVAEWTINPKTGDKSFRYLSPLKKGGADD